MKFSWNRFIKRRYSLTNLTKLFCACLVECKELCHKQQSQGPALLWKHTTLLHQFWPYQQLSAGKWRIASASFCCYMFTHTQKKGLLWQARNFKHVQCSAALFQEGRLGATSLIGRAHQTKGSFVFNAPKLCNRQGLFHGLNGKTEVFLASLL